MCQKHVCNMVSIVNTLVSDLSLATYLVLETDFPGLGWALRSRMMTSKAMSAIQMNIQIMTSLLWLSMLRKTRSWSCYTRSCHWFLYSSAVGVYEILDRFSRQWNIIQRTLHGFKEGFRFCATPKIYQKDICSWLWRLLAEPADIISL